MADDDLITDDELYEHYSFKAGKGQEPLRVDKFLMNFVENASRNKVQQAAKDGNIFVNGVAVKANHRVKANDEVKVMFAHPPHEYLLVSEPIPLDIVYEDEELIIINKPAGLVVHPGHGNYQGTLINGLIYHFQHLPMNSSNRPGLVHRIDKDTSGLLVVAKTEEAMNHLAKQFFNKTSEREYVALVWGNLAQDEGTIIGHIGRHPKNRLQMTVFPDGSEGKEAITHYKVLERFGYVTLVSCRLETGRTHQIRAHFTYIGHPLFNDERYGGDKILKGTTSAKYKQFVENCFKLLPRQALHAKTLGVEKPSTGQMLRFDSEIPQDMQQCIEKWRNYLSNREVVND
ncbi:MAG: RluA family pseudouridine synthase [Capnocytophaga gingivalis]|jgi:pseudouridine synthase, rluA family|uniref:RluA family pseudouridine synthase n=1 Tax=Capnocytophaga gingivalis TaxID=1017 RepID=UPI003622B31F